MLEKLKLFFNHQRYQSLAVLIICLAAIGIYGCNPKVSSLTSSKVKVDREGLDNEVETFLSHAEQQYKKLDEQDKFRELVLKSVIAYSNGTPINPIGFLTTVLGIFGIGATVDNVRRRKTESKLKSIIAKKLPE